jgi:choline dehydrogenase-like flavoprotein
LAPYYDRAERLFSVRGAAGEDPTDPPRGPFPYPAVPHQGRMVTVVDRLKDLGLHPSALPLGLLRLGEPNGCRLCNTCNAYPCKIHAKSDVEVCALAPALSSSAVTLWTDTLVRKLHTNGGGDRIVAAEIMREGRTSRIEAPLFVVSCGAVNSAALLLRSASAAHTEGLGNSSGMLGRNYMAHFSTMLGGFMPPRHETSFQKTVGVNDYYLKGPDRDYPLGNIQSQGRSNSVIAKAAGPPVSRWIPDWAFQSWFSRSVEWLAMTEDLPDPDNRVTVTGDGRIQVRWEPRNLVAHRELLAVARGLLRQIGCLQVVQASLGASNTTHQCGTAVFGTDPKTSVLDPWCRSHDVANLFVVDSSFFPSSAAVNPGLTIAAQALRTADHIHETYSSGGYRT